MAHERVKEKRGSKIALMLFGRQLESDSPSLDQAANQNIGN